MSDDALEVNIESIAAGGDGVGRAEGMVVFVPRTAPGDRVRVRVDRRKRFGRGVIESLLEPSPLRVDPPCAHYLADRCGGCQLQHISYDAQVAAKGAIVRDAITRIGKRTIETPVVQRSPAPWRYRGKLTLAFRRRSVDSPWVAGLHPYDDPVGVFQLVDCPITDERVVAAWRAIMAHGDLLPAERSLRGSVRLAPGGVTLTMEGGKRWTRAEELLAAIPELLAIWWKPDESRRRLVAERAAAPAGASFVQVNADVAARLRAYVLERARAHAPRTLVDAYAGTGDTAAALAADGTRVLAIELDREAADACARRLPAGSRTVVGRVEDHLAGALPADVVIVNPPRTGMDARAVSALDAARPRPRAIVYVSCDPATLGRDLARLSGYRVASLQSFDMFPQTAHVETVCELVPEAA